MSEIEELLRGHTASVDDALSGFQGTVTTVQDAITALTARVDAIGNRVIPAASRNVMMMSDAGRRSLASSSLDEGRPGNVIPRRRVGGPSLSISADDRAVVAAILRGNRSAPALASMREMSDPDGGYLVPEVLRDQIEALVLRQSPIRQVARVVDFTSGRTTVPVNLRGATAGWVGELEPRDETPGPQLAAVTPPGGTVYALPSASEELIDDAIVNMDVFIEENVVDAIAEKESLAFIGGDGIRKPAGFISPTGPQPSVDPDGVRAFGSVQYITTNSVSPGVYDDLGNIVRMVFALKAGYRQAPGVAWLASTDYIAHMASLRDSAGKPIYMPSMQEDVPGMMLGYPVIECEHMASMTAGTYPLAFGNWQRGYIIGDRTQLNILRDPYTRKGVVQWYFRKRVHGCVLNSEAIKLMKVVPTV